MLASSHIRSSCRNFFELSPIPFARPLTLRDETHLGFLSAQAGAPCTNLRDPPRWAEPFKLSFKRDTVLFLALTPPFILSSDLVRSSRVNYHQSYFLTLRTKAKNTKLAETGAKFSLVQSCGKNPIGPPKRSLNPKPPPR